MSWQAKVREHTAIACMSLFAASCARSGMGDEQHTEDSAITRENDPCDQDGDGYESRACGGDDCDDDPGGCGELCFPGNFQVCASSLDEGPTPDTDCDAQTTPCAVPVPVSAIIGDFSSALLRKLFAPYTHGSTAVSDDGGYLTISAHINEHGYAGWVTRYVFDFVGASFAFEILEVTSLEIDSHATSYVNAVDDAGDTLYSISIEAGNIRFQNATDIYGSATYDPALHRYCRLREHDGTVLGECSSDSRTWTLLGSTTSALDLTQVKMNIGAGTYAESTTAPGRFRVDNLNSLPGQAAELNEQ